MCFHKSFLWWSVERKLRTEFFRGFDQDSNITKKKKKRVSLYNFFKIILLLFNNLFFLNSLIWNTLMIHVWTFTKKQIKQKWMNIALQQLYLNRSLSNKWCNKILYSVVIVQSKLKRKNNTKNPFFLKNILSLFCNWTYLKGYHYGYNGL